MVEKFFQKRGYRRIGQFDGRPGTFNPSPSWVFFLDGAARTTTQNR